ncbi:MAG: riboflavin synthase, partial [Kiritimatiellaeota bacterium]|nr:riboflavin synthase [Kiritimatiellota bacterium]
MFTGIIQKIGTLARRARANGAWSLSIACDPWDEPLRLGESVAVQGVCLTAAR